MSEHFKQLAAERAAEDVKSGMRLGIGTGSTAEHFVRALAVKVSEGLQVVGVPTSERTHALCVELGVPMTTLDNEPELDLTVDGADELDAHLSLIKGGGGALLREKIVAAASKEMVVIADSSKAVSRLGAFPLPIEVVPFGLEATRRSVLSVLSKLELPDVLHLREKDGQAFVTDGGHVILDAHLEDIPDARELAMELTAIPGVVDHGLFIDLATRAYVAGEDGVAEILPETAA
ncbi:ribose-5-phosphate isomerase RpiA [Roseibium denhamense]|uniref:Ribose-5-phosphate isomerase A n=1 Tax=Roseibium denhamense TaxID=76305 RepID=A0ABY1NUE7_9HYPH|nr:ribose-5-phosphate isomerase RpiA [Roseibium denhamense]MTI05446.1 ribose-5-phosphate isomerase RpiA [Roseibium denhamense]SMP18603.1 ribose-5-phosphate isomerase [Roseibium denhamense]